MTNATRLAAFAACLLLVSQACEREEEVVAPETAAFLTATTSTLTSVVTDPAGDLFEFVPAAARQAYRDIVRAEVRMKDGTFFFSMEMAGDVPEAPEVAPPGYKLLVWPWRLNTNLQTFPAGLPFEPGIPKPAEYLVWIVWDGTNFSARLIDRTPLLAGHDAIVTPLAFSVQGAVLTTSVGADAIGNPASFSWSVETQNWTSPLGSEAWHALDLAPALDAGEPPAIWPSP